MLRLLVLAALVVASTQSKADLPTFDVIDVASCRWWWLGRDFDADKRSAYITEIPAFAALEKRGKLGQATGEYMLSGYETSNGRDEDSLACIFRRDETARSEIECFGAKKPLAGVKFKQRGPAPAGSLPVLACVANCGTTTVKRIFSVPSAGDEVGQDKPSGLYEAEADRFNKKCRRK